MPERFRHGLPCQLVQHRFRIEQIEVARPALHEKPDDRFRPGWTVRRAGRQRIERVEWDAFRAGGHAVESQKIAKGQGTKAAPGAKEKLAARTNGEDVGDDSVGVRAHGGKGLNPKSEIRPSSVAGSPV